MSAVPATPTDRRRLWLVLAVLTVGSVFALDWNLTAVSDLDELRAAFGRLWQYVAAFSSLDLSGEMLAKCTHLAMETVAVALLGVAFGLLLAYPLAICSSRAVMIGEDPRRGWLPRVQRVVMEGSRLLLDVLRGVPDFVWALVIANFTGVNAITGLLAIAVSVGGILGKVLSEQLDNLDPSRYAPLRSTGARSLQVLLYGIQPLASRSMLSFILMRTECAVRNASVIGVVGGGGIGAALWDEYMDGQWPRVATVLLFLLAVTAAADLAANLLRNQLRVDPNHPRAATDRSRRASNRRRAVALVGILILLSGSAFVLSEPLMTVVGELRRLEWGFIAKFTGGLMVPDLDPDTLKSVLRHSLVPIAIGTIATLLGGLFAALLTFPASVTFQLEADRFTGENLGAFARVRRWLALLSSRGVALVLRGVPEVGWVMLLAVFFRAGVTPCVFAVALHSAGVLHRVFTEAVDNVPHGNLERLSGACRKHMYVYGALPRAAQDWKTYTFFQFEVNVRIGVALGVVGAGGLGDRFQSNLGWRELPTASTYLWAMVLLTVLIDRTSRWLQMRRLRC